jgi:hypothetical protein
MNDKFEVEKNEKKETGWIGGLILIVIGLLALFGQLLPESITSNLGLYVVSALGLVFIVWGIAARNAGPMIPGGILSGIGLGIVLIEAVNFPANVDEGGVFMLAFALGWALIVLLTAVFTPKTHWWPLIPGGIMAFIGLAVLFGGVFLNALELVGILWPVALIILGIFILYQARQAKEKTV